MCVSSVPIGRERIPFYRRRGRPYKREGERESVRLLSLVANAISYKTIVGVHNTVYARRMWEDLPHLPRMANDGAHNTVDAQRHVGGFTVFAWYVN